MTLQRLIGSRLFASGVVLAMSLAGRGQALPLDPAVRTGKLANGFTYYIRHNEEPAKRVQMYLVCNVGSILEDEDQQGLAHFMEHMNFNGTTHYPKNELVDYLQKAGVRFGADLNAHTTFDETVYQLPLPTEDPTLVVSGLQIMRDWAQEALLDSTEIEKERGVVLEEERLGKGAKDRMSKQYLPVLVNHSRYANRLPIGLDSILIHFRPAVIRRYHHDWYRPDLQALIVVGDIDVDAIEKMVRQKFADMKNPANERPRTEYSIPLTESNQFIAVTDKEAGSTDLEILIPHKEHPLTTAADYLAAMKRGLFSGMMGAREYAELSQNPDPSFINSSSGIQGFMGGADMFAFSVSAKDGQLQRAFQQGWDVVEKVKRYGFTQSELDRAKENYLRSMEAALKEKDKTPSVDYVGEYQSLFLHGNAAPGFDWEYKFVKENIGGITLQDIQAVIDEYMKKESGIDVLITAAEKEKANLPSEATVAGWLKAEKDKPLTAYKDSAVGKTLMAVKPKPGKVVSRKEVPSIGVTQVTLSNGVKLVLKPTTFKNDEISFKAFAPGGTSLYNDSDYDAASAAAIIPGFGVGDLNPVELNKLLTGKVARVGPSIGGRSEGFGGSAAPSDLETALQLVNLYFTKPRKDEVLYNNIITKSRTGIENRYADPGNVFNDTMAYVMGNYSYRNSPPTLAKLSKITLQKAYEVYKERFADASGFTFVFVGNFKVDSILPLLELYLGSLPSLHKNEQARDLGAHIPAGHLVKNVYKGKEDKALVRIIYSGDYHYSTLDNLYLQALGQVLQIKVLEHLREQESEVYSPSVQTSNNKYPQNRYAIIIAFGCAPRNVDHLAEMVQHELDTLVAKGPDAEDVQKYKASYVKNVELALKDNGFWLNYLTGQYENGDDVLNVLDYQKNLEKVTPAALQEAARHFLDGKNVIRFALLPEHS